MNTDTMINEIPPTDASIRSLPSGSTASVGDPTMAWQAKLKPDYAVIQSRIGDPRTVDRIIAHYEIERRLADRLRAASREERPRVYSEVYSELFDSLPDHPQKRSSAETCGGRVADRIRLLAPLLGSDGNYLEIGCGNAALPMAMAPLAHEVLGLDVTDALIDYAAAPCNFRFVKTDGVDIRLPDCSVDLAHSDQLIEHLHVDDVEPQVAEIYRVLKPGGHYLCSTPNRMTGPHDISIYFDDAATGLHMKEYDYASLREVLRRAGFSSVRFPLVIRGFHLMTPPYPLLRGIERIVKGARGSLCGRRFVNAIIGITALATK
jgi:SAM-dependent methyltransferase